MRVSVPLAFLIGLITGAGAFLALARVNERVQNAYLRSEARSLWGMHRAWLEAGKPTGTNATQLAEEFRRNGWTPAVRSLELDGQTYQTLGCDSELMYHEGSLWLTTNGAVLWEQKKFILK